MAPLAHRLAAAPAWLRRAIACLAGATGALALPPLGLFPALVVAMTVAVWLLDAERLRRAGAGMLRPSLITGWWFGFGYFVTGLWWLGAAFLVEADEFAWALPLGVIGLPALLALFPAAGFALAGWLWRPYPGRILAFAGALGLCDYLRGVLFTGFPWNTWGMALGAHLPTAQIASVVGLYGLGVLAVAIAAAPAALDIDWRAAARRARTCALLPPLLAAATLAALFIYGEMRIPAGPAATVSGVKLRVAQPGITQDTAVFNWENREKILNHYVRLTEGAGVAPLATSGVTHVFWPESAFPFLLADSPDALRVIGDMLPPGAVLVTGAARGEGNTPGGRPERYYNSMQVVDHAGRIVDFYDKSRLVPFGEYLPFGGVLDALGLRQFVHVPGGFTAGRPGGGLTVPGLPPVTPLICYEAIFPGHGAPRRREGVIVNVTNDGWFGDTPGPWQHFAQARLRAIESGLPLIRAANTGISAVLDPWGRTVAMLPPGETGFIDSALPQAISTTIYTRLGNFFFAFLLIFCFSLSAPSLKLGGRRHGRQDVRS